MNIIVCVKQVPSSAGARIDPKTNTILRDGKASVINPFDSHALEAALLLKDTCGGKVSALSMGIPACETMLRDCVARGADEAMLLTDRAFAGADTLATSYALSLGVKALGDFDLILCGRMATDGDTAQIGPELAERLGIPHVTDVYDIQPGEGFVTVRRETDQELQTLRVPLPALLTVTRELGNPRMPSITGILKGENFSVQKRSCAELNADPDQCGQSGSPTRVVHTYTPTSDNVCRELTGSTAEKCAALAAVIKEVL